MKKETIDFYGTKDNYIHLKFGNARKMYNFTEDLIAEYPDFTREYARYFEGNASKFKSPFQIVSYVYSQKLPVHFYYNFTDEPATSLEEIMDYLMREQSFIGDLTQK